MFNKKLASLAIAAVAGFSAVYMPAASAIPVGLELSLLVDVSGSVDPAEFQLQRDGYVAAFQDATIQANIATITGGIAVNYIQWSGAGQQQQSVGWTHITNAASANAFATAISNAARPFTGNTAPGSAINFAAPLFTGNGFEGARLVIDVSGDGSQNEGDNTANARNSALAGGVNAINGLPILGSEANLLTWYQNNIQGGTNSFTIPAASFADFENAVKTKIGRETNNTPEPGSLALAGLALTGLFGLRRRAKQA